MIGLATCQLRSFGQRMAGVDLRRIKHVTMVNVCINVCKYICMLISYLAGASRSAEGLPKLKETV